MGRSQQTTVWLPDRHRLFVHGLQLSWFTVVLWFELGTFRHVLSNCTWPKPQPPLTGDERTSHILLIADPQVLDAHSYPDRAPWLMALTQFFVDLNMRKSWRLVALKLKPHVVVFLGDMMDGGRGDIGDDEYEAYYRRFINIFKLPYSPLPVFYIPGNHDTGLGTSSSFSPLATTRYISHFGLLNNQISIANHTLLFIDAPGLAEEDHQRRQHRYNYDQWTAIPGGPVEYVKHFAADKRERPTVLFSHIPLSRPDRTSCGKLREKGTIHAGAGFGYQNTLSDDASNFLLQNVRPSIIFSGDDHDYCSITHPLPPKHENPSHKHARTEEISVKSFSMAMGIKRTGFQLLSLISPSPNQAQLHMPCQLPDQVGIYLWVYLPLLVLSLLGLIIMNAHRICAPPSALKTSRSKTPATRTKGEEEEEATIGLTSAPFGRKEKLEVENGTSGRRLSASGPASESVTASEDEWAGHNGYGCCHEKVDENGNGNGNGNETVHFLPAPVSPRSSPSTNHNHQPSERTLFSWTFILGNRRRWISISEVSRRMGRREGRGGRRRKVRRGFVHGFAHDVVSVAWPPLGLFAVIAWWMFR